MQSCITGLTIFIFADTARFSLLGDASARPWGHDKTVRRGLRAEDLRFGGHRRKSSQKVSWKFLSVDCYVFFFNERGLFS